jgi:hypothetical protein
LTTVEAPSEHRDAPVDALSWIRAALWAPDADVELVAVERGDPRAAWLARPDGDDPELLVPLAPNRAAAAVSRRFWDGMPPTRRARQWAGELALRTGAAQRLWPGRVAVVGAASDLADPERSLPARLAAVLGHAELIAAVTARPTHYNAKPVLALFTPDGRPVAFAKVAVDEVSTGYVRTEIDWLGRAAHAAAPLRAPRLLAAPTWQGRPVAVLEPLALPRLPRHPAGWAREAVAAAVLGLGPREHLPVADAGPVVAGRREAAEADDAVLAGLVEGVVERAGSEIVEVGPWHGDLSPWNTASRGHQVLVWDWELAGDRMPVGSDLRHEAVMVATHLRGHGAPAALAPLDVDDPAVAVYLLELARRDRHAARAGRTDDEHALGRAAAARLTAASAR